MSGRKFTKPARDHEYLVLIEKLARDVVEEAVRADTFEVFLDKGNKSLTFLF